jgi:hypothetical protein
LELKKLLLIVFWKKISTLLKQSLNYGKNT